MEQKINRMINKRRKFNCLVGLVLLSTMTFAQTNNSRNFFSANNDFAASKNDVPEVSKDATTKSKSGIFNNLYIGFNAGATFMHATLRDKPYSWAVGAFFGKELNSKLDIQTNLLYGKMHSEGLYGGLYIADDVNFIDASLIAKLHLKDFILKKSPNFLRDLYLMGGGGITFYNAKVTNPANNTFIMGQGWANDSTKTSMVKSLFIPLGLGVSFNVDKLNRYYITTEYTYRYSFNNELDGGYTTNAGHYSYASLGFVYNIGNSAGTSKANIIEEAVEQKTKQIKENKAKEESVRDNNAKDEKVKNVRVATDYGLLNNWYAGVNAGATTILATLRDKPYSWAAGAVLGKQITRKLGVQTNLLYGKMHSEGDYFGQMLANDIDFMDASLMLKFNLNDLIFNKSPKVLREFYLLAGGGLTFFNSKVINMADSTFITGIGWDATGTNKTSKVSTPFIPIGLGMSFNLGNTGRYFLTTEFAYRYSSDNQLDGGLTTHPAHYTYASVGLVYNLGKPTFSPQQITADAIEERVKSTVVAQVKDEMAANIQAEIKPIKDELDNHSKILSENKASINAIKSDIEARINAMNSNSSYNDGGVTTANRATQIPAGNEISTALTSIYFAFNSLYLTPDMEREIAIFAKMMKKNKGLKCEITGNASNVGSPEYNLMLSEKRAQAVASFLTKEFGIEENRLIIKSIGIDDPLAKNLHKINRRVDMQLFW